MCIMPHHRVVHGESFVGSPDHYRAQWPDHALTSILSIHKACSLLDAVKTNIFVGTSVPNVARVPIGTPFALPWVPSYNTTILKMAVCPAYAENAASCVHRNCPGY